MPAAQNDRNNIILITMHQMVQCFDDANYYHFIYKTR